MYVYLCNADFTNQAHCLLLIYIMHHYLMKEKKSNLYPSIISLYILQRSSAMTSENFLFKSMELASLNEEPRFMQIFFSPP